MSESINYPLIDVVVPVYNAELYLQDCIASIEAQSYPAVHIIIIDDGSTDSSKLISQESIIKNDNITFVTQSNHGVGYTRNRALSLIKGEYVAFVDADDTIAPDYIDLLYRSAKENKADIAVASFCSEEQFSLLERVTERGLDTQNVQCFFERNVIMNSLYYAVTNKLYKTEFLHKANANFAENLGFGEDLLFNVGAYLSNPSITIEKRARYFYRHNEQSVTRQRNPNRCYDQFSVFTTLNKDYENKLINEPLIVAELFWMFTISGGILSRNEGANLNDLLNYYKYTMGYAADKKYGVGTLLNGAVRWASIESSSYLSRTRLLLLAFLLITHSWSLLAIILRWMRK